MLPRFLTTRLPTPDTRRLVMITGARQTGKTTLAESTFAGLRYISLDEAEARAALRELPTRSWGSTVGQAVLDEAQKEPAIFEKLKFAFDRGEIDFSVILGSSQILMLKNIRETLAGRVFIYELWPLMLSELASGGQTLRPPLLERLIRETGRADDILPAEQPVLLGEDAHTLSRSFNHAVKWGGMPGLLPLPDSERSEWLRSYTNTYLERDLADLARLDDLVPFRRFLRLAALRSGQILTYADLARDAAVSPSTARNYLHYLTLSYQVVMLEPYFSTQIKRLVKAPKLYWLDPGLWRYQTGFWGEMSGPLLETFVVGECHKWIKTMQPEVELYYFRTYGGMEVDLLLTTPSGVWGLEVKTSRRADARQPASLRRLAAQFGGRWRGGLLVNLGDRIEQLDRDLWVVPAPRLLG